MVSLEALPFHTLFQGMRPFLVACAFGALALTQAPPPDEAGLQEASLQEASAPPSQPKPFVFVPAEGALGVTVPRHERLVYRTYLDVAVLSAYVGDVTQTCTVEEQAAPLVVTRPTALGESASIRLEAKGSYLGYELESTLETRILPQEWPRLLYQQLSDSHRGVRRREVMLGRKNGVAAASYRGDTTKGAPDGTRIWRKAQERAVPEGTLDMLTAVFMARALIASDAERLTFPLLDKTRVWKLTLRRGEERRTETGAGVFDVVEVVLEPEAFPGEVMEDKTKQFEGVFGIHGTIHLWVEKKTGVAVRIQGDLPISDGLITLGVDVVLDSYTGTPPEFAPVPVAEPEPEER